MERYHRTVKGEINLLPYEMPSALEEAIRSFVQRYNYQRYHEALGDVIPFDVYTGRHLQILQRRKEAQARHWRQEGVTVALSGGRALGPKVSVISRAQMSHFRWSCCRSPCSKLAADAFQPETESARRV